MKKVITLLFAVTLLVGFSSVANGQTSSSDSHTINANANVVGAMQVGNEEADLEFNNVLVNSWKTVNAITNSAIATGGTVTGVTGGESRGFFSIEIVQGTPIDYSLAVPANLVSPSEATLPIDFNTANIPEGNSTTFNGFLTTTDPSGTNDLSGAILPNGAGSDFSSPATSPITLDNLAMPEGDKVYLVVGGTVKAGESQALGSYTGTLTLTATVND